MSDIFYDIENGSDLAYSVSENIEGLNTNVADTVLILSFIEGIYGSGTVEITASDVTIGVSAPASGKLCRLYVEEDTVVVVGDVLAQIDLEET